MPKTGTFQTNPSSVILVVIGFAALLLQGCISLKPFSNVYTEKAIYSEGESIHLVLVESDFSGTYIKDSYFRYGQTWYTYEYRHAPGPYFEYAVSVLDPELNEEFDIDYGATGGGDGSEERIRLSPFYVWERDEWLFAGRGSYYAIVRWSPRYSSYVDTDRWPDYNQWPEENVMKIPFTVE